MVAGGVCDPAAGQPPPDASSVTAHPGDDLEALALTHGHLVLAPGDYALGAPLHLTRPIEISGPRSARLLFHQAPGDAAWSRAIELCVGRTALRGFAIGFAGPVRFAPESQVSYGSAVIGTVVDRVVADRRAGLLLDDLDVTGPPAASAWEPAVHLVVMKDSGGGAIRGNVLHGGTVRLLGGPWAVVGNQHLGALPDTFAFEGFAGHFLHDLTFTGNRLAPDAGAHARTWRFLVMTAWGFRGLVADNTVVGAGERSDDAAHGIPLENAPEAMLTEAYGTVFEGIPSSISADGRILRIPGTLAGALSERGAVTIHEGPAAGSWRRILHVVNARECIVDPPLPTAAGPLPAMNISDAGFRDFAFARNRFDLSANVPPLHGQPTGLVLAGNHYGTQVVANRFIGGQAARIVSTPTEHQPFRWGWGYAPVVGLTVADNVCEDTGAVVLGPEHGDAIKGGAGRTYFSADIRGNTFRYSPAWLAAHPGPPLALSVGSPATPDPRESLIRWSGNSAALVDGGAVEAVADLHALLVDGTVVESGQRLPPPSEPGAQGGSPRSRGCGAGSSMALLPVLLALLGAWRVRAHRALRATADLRRR
jgi:hypothetical protein